MNLKRGLKGLSFLLIAIGAFIIIIQPFSTTGAVIDISTATSRVWFFTGISFIIGGSILIYLSKESRLIKILCQEMQSGSVKGARELMGWAGDLGLILQPGKGGSAYKVFKPDRTPLIGRSGRQVEIHYHTRGMAVGTYRGILKDLVMYANSA